MPTPSPAWDDRYPDRSALRREINAITDAFLDALFSIFPREAIAAVHAKGSARKPWESPLDYVPELSDVDFHVLFAGDRPEDRYFQSSEDALTMQRALDEGYARRVPRPLHTPRVQLVIANRLQRQRDHIPSVARTVETLIGPAYSEAPVDPGASVGASRRIMLTHEPYLCELGEHVIDKVGRHLWEIMRGMNWRISPTGPRVLEMRGVPYREAWGANRTTIRAMLCACGEEALAEDYAAYYLYGWEYFLSGRSDNQMARQMLLAGSRVLTRGIAVAREHDSTEEEE